ncbi:MAG: hypothetical protein AAF944_07780 [Bacteroidota bacterium]
MKIIKGITAVALIVIASFSSSALHAQSIFVSPAGDDSQPGTLEQPIKNLQTAIDRLEGTAGTIYVRGGMYRIDSTISITPTNSGTKIMAYNWENPALSVGKPISNWQLVRHPRPGKDRPAKVWKAQLEEGQSFLTLYDQTGILPRCASPRFKTYPENEEVQE